MKLWLTTLWFLLIATPVLLSADAPEGDTPPAPISETVVKVQIEEDVSLDQAVESMKLRANLINMPLVGELPLSEQLEAMGEESRRMEIFQFCDPVTAKEMVEANIDFAAFLPCRIALIEDQEGQGWLIMADLDRIMAGTDLSPELEDEAIEVRDALHDIMEAGATGDI